jgi:hypothetical protein
MDSKNTQINQKIMDGVRSTEKDTSAKVIKGA